VVRGLDRAEARLDPGLQPPGGEAGDEQQAAGDRQLQQRGRLAGQFQQGLAQLFPDFDQRVDGGGSSVADRGKSVTTPRS